MTVEATGNFVPRPFQAPLPRALEWRVPSVEGAVVDSVAADTSRNYLLPHVASPEVELLNGIHDPVPEGPDETGKIGKPATLHNARILVADVYQAWGYIKAEDRTPEGYIKEKLDPHVADSDYFARIRDKQVVATARLIRKQDISDFPALAEFGIDPSQLSDIDPDASHFREVSALAKRPKVGHRTDVLGVYATMMKDTIESGGRYWLMSADTRLAGKLRQLFGRRSFMSLGAPKFMMGSPTEPLLFDINKGLRLLGKRFVPSDIKAIFREGLQGIDPSNLDPETRRILARQGVIDKEAAPRQKIFTPKRLAMAGLAAYAFSRAGVIPATSLDEEGVNPAVFLGLDVATIPPYIEGLARFGDKRGERRRRLGGLTLAAASFAAPYAYVYAEAPESANLPEAFGAFGAILVGYMGIKKVISSYRNRQNETLTRPE